MRKRAPKVGDPIGDTGFVLVVVAPHRLAIVNQRSPRGGEVQPLFEASRSLPVGHVLQTATSMEALTAKCEAWLREQHARKDGGALRERKTVVSGMYGYPRGAA